MIMANIKTMGFNDIKDSKHLTTNTHVCEPIVSGKIVNAQVSTPKGIYVLYRGKHTQFRKNGKLGKHDKKYPMTNE